MSGHYSHSPLDTNRKFPKAEVANDVPLGNGKTSLVLQYGYGSIPIDTFLVG